VRSPLLSALIFLAAFGLNLATLSPAVHPDDSPETVAAGATLSIQHPPGYPLHSLAGRLAFLAFPGGAAFRINLLSALLGALGLLLFAHALRLLASELAGRELPLSLAAAPTAVLACSLSLWFQSSIAKGGIYTLNFFLAQATLLALLWARRQAPPLAGLRLAALFFGLGMANHWTSQVVLLPGYAFMLAELWWRAGRPRISAAWALPAASALGLGACGISLYLFLPLRSLQGPVMSWGEPWTLRGFWWVFNRSQYAGIESGKTLAAFLALASRALDDLKGEFSWLGILGIAGGWALLLRRRPWLGLALLSMPLTLLLAVCLKANPPADSLWIIDPYLLPFYSGLALGLAGWLALVPWGAAAALALGALGLGIWHFPDADQSGNYLGYDYANNLFLSCPKNSQLFCEGDSNTALPLYARFVLGKRQDIAPVALVLSDYPWYRDSLLRNYPGLKIPARPLSPGGNMAWMASADPSRPAILSNSYTKEWVDPKRVVPRGLVNVLIPKGPPTPAQLKANRIWEAYALRGAFAPELRMDPLSVRLVRDNYREVPARLAYALQAAGDQGSAELEFLRLGGLGHGWAAPWVQAGNCAFFKGQLEQAGLYWKRAVDEEPSSAEALANLALYYFDKKNYDQSLLFSRKSLEKNPSLASAREIQDKSLALLNGMPMPAAGPGQAAAGAKSATAYAAEGDQYAAKGMAQQALDAYGRAMALGFVNAGVYRNRAVMWSKLNQPSKAAGELDKALQLEPKNAELHKYLAIMKFNAGDPKGALPELMQSQSLNPADPQLAPLISQVKARLGQ
jgi:tetratricopeptide (TPR) repeat protein